jgi:hypothetical protein
MDLNKFKENNCKLCGSYGSCALFQNYLYKNNDCPDECKSKTPLDFSRDKKLTIENPKRSPCVQKHGICLGFVNNECDGPEDGVCTKYIKGEYMKTTKEKIEIMQAFEDGEKIQIWDRLIGWNDVALPKWQWNNCDYRIKPKPQPRPITFEEFLDDKPTHIINASGWYVPFSYNKESGYINVIGEQSLHFDYVVKNFHYSTDGRNKKSFMREG